MYSFDNWNFNYQATVYEKKQFVGEVDSILLHRAGKT